MGYKVMVKGLGVGPLPTLRSDRNLSPKMSEVSPWPFWKWPIMGQYGDSRLSSLFSCGIWQEKAKARPFPQERVLNGIHLLDWGEEGEERMGRGGQPSGDRAGVVESAEHWAFHFMTQEIPKGPGSPHASPHPALWL